MELRRLPATPLPGHHSSINPTARCLQSELISVDNEATTWCSLSSHLLLVLTSCFFPWIVWWPRTVQLRLFAACLMSRWRTKVRSIWTSHDALWRRSSWVKWRHFNQTNGNRSECPRRRRGLGCSVRGGFWGEGWNCLVCTLLLQPSVRLLMWTPWHLGMLII